MQLWFFASGDWPDSVDRIAIAIFVLAIFLIPLVCYWLTVLDIRAYMRALRGALVRISGPVAELPGWFKDETPPCLRSLGLTLPCNEDDVKEAYRHLAKKLHPDRGGNIHRFLLLQEQFERAMDWVKNQDHRSKDR